MSADRFIQNQNIGGPDRGGPDIYGQKPTITVPHFNNREVISKTYKTSPSTNAELATNPNRSEILRLRESLKALQHPPGPDVHPRREHTIKPSSTGAVEEQGRFTVYLEEAVADSIPFIMHSPETEVTLGDTSIGLGGKRERSIIFEGQNAQGDATQFQISPDSITRKDPLLILSNQSQTAA